VHANVALQRKGRMMKENVLEEVGTEDDETQVAIIRYLDGRTLVSCVLENERRVVSHGWQLMNLLHCKLSRVSGCWEVCRETQARGNNKNQYNLPFVRLSLPLRLMLTTTIYCGSPCCPACLSCPPCEVHHRPRIRCARRGIVLKGC